MRWYVGLVVGLSLLFTNPAAAQFRFGKAGEKKSSTEPGDVYKPEFRANEVEVKFGDNSTVRMLVLQDSIEVVTKFGKLLVPLTEVRKIDLGVHLPEGVGDKIDAAMKKLGSDNFKDRDEAVNQLVALGPGAYPTLTQASKSPEQEVSQRALMALKRLRAKFPANQLRTTVNDRIVTNDFTMVGRITSPTIKAQTPYFGNVELKLTELATIVWLGSSVDIEIAVEASKYAHHGAWMDTGVQIEMGAGLNIQVSGEIDLLPGNGNQFICGPQGNNQIGRVGAGGRLPGMLVGKIGPNGTMFSIGERYHGVPNQEGRLYLQIIPGNFGNNQPASGSFKAKIATGLDIR